MLRPNLQRGSWRARIPPRPVPVSSPSDSFSLTGDRSPALLTDFSSSSPGAYLQANVDRDILLCVVN